MKKVIGILPARLASTRLPRKMLLRVNGKPLIYWTWRQAKKAKLLDEVVIATDSPEIRDAAHAFGAVVVMTATTHVCGSDRVHEAARHFPWARIIVNIQGDEPILSPEAVDAAVRRLLTDPTVPMVTLATHFRNRKELEDSGNAKVVLNERGSALYFSRSIIPYARNTHKNYLKHIGLYAFRRPFLNRYVRLPHTPLEHAESLEQLRALEHGYCIAVVTGNFTSMSVDTPSDLRAVRAIIGRR